MEAHWHKKTMHVADNASEQTKTLFFTSPIVHDSQSLSSSHPTGYSF